MQSIVWRLEESNTPNTKVTSLVGTGLTPDFESWLGGEPSTASLGRPQDYAVPQHTLLVSVGVSSWIYDQPLVAVAHQGKITQVFTRDIEIKPFRNSVH